MKHTDTNNLIFYRAGFKINKNDETEKCNFNGIKIEITKDIFWHIIDSPKYYNKGIVSVSSRISNCICNRISNESMEKKTVID